MRVDLQGAAEERAHLLRARLVDLPVPGLGVHVAWVRAYGLEGLGFGVQGSGFRVSGFGFRVQGRNGGTQGLKVSGVGLCLSNEGSISARSDITVLPPAHDLVFRG